MAKFYETLEMALIMRSMALLEEAEALLDAAMAIAGMEDNGEVCKMVSRFDDALRELGV